MLERFHSAVLVCSEDLDLPFDSVEQLCQPAYDQAIDHLMGQGRRRWAMVSNGPANHRKYRAIEAAMQERGLDTTAFHCHLVDCLSDESGLSIHSPVPVPGQEARICEALAEVDAVFCPNDNLAAVVMGWLQQFGRRVPEDIAVIGYNDQFLSGSLSPPLASITRHDQQVVEAATELFFDRLERSEKGEVPEPRRRSVYPSFVLRASAGAV